MSRVSSHTIRLALRLRQAGWKRSRRKNPKTKRIQTRYTHLQTGTVVKSLDEAKVEQSKMDRTKQHARGDLYP